VDKGAGGFQKNADFKNLWCVCTDKGIMVEEENRQFFGILCERLLWTALYLIFTSSDMPKYMHL